MRVLGIAGSLRKDSWNRKLLLAAAELLPEDVELELWDGLKAVPPYDEDDDGLPAPPSVAKLRAAIAGADAVLVATPEYNSSVPGQLKNALDWASRPFATNVLRFKPVAVVGASTGAFGAVWAQAELRKVLSADRRARYRRRSRSRARARAVRRGRPAPGRGRPRAARGGRFRARRSGDSARRRGRLVPLRSGGHGRRLRHDLPAPALHPRGHPAALRRHRRSSAAGAAASTCGRSSCSSRRSRSWSGGCRRRRGPPSRSRTPSSRAPSRRSSGRGLAERPTCRRSGR